MGAEETVQREENKRPIQRDLRDIHEGITTQDPEVKYKKALENLRSEYSLSERRLPVPLGGEVNINTHQSDNLIEVVHYYDDRLPYPIKSAFSNADCIITELSREYGRDDGRVKTTIYGGPSDLVEEGDTPTQAKKTTSTSSSTSRKTKSRYSSSPSTSNRTTTNSNSDVSGPKMGNIFRLGGSLASLNIGWQLFMRDLLTRAVASTSTSSSINMQRAIQMVDSMVQLTTVLGCLVLVGAVMLWTVKNQAR